MTEGLNSVVCSEVQRKNLLSFDKAKLKQLTAYLKAAESSPSSLAQFRESLVKLA